MSSDALVGSPSSSAEQAVLLATLPQGDDGSSTKAEVRRNTTGRHARRDRANEARAVKSETRAEEVEFSKSDMIAKIADRDRQINELTKSHDTLKAEFAEMQVQMKRESETLLTKVANDTAATDNAAALLANVENETPASDNRTALLGEVANETSVTDNATALIANVANKTPSSRKRNRTACQSRE